MNADFGSFRMVSDRDGAFPWTKFERLLRQPEIFGPQWEDEVPLDPAVAVRPQEFRPHQFVWLVMRETQALGFVAAGLRGRHWVDLHVGFREGVLGPVKKSAIIWTFGKLFFVIGVRKISAFVPEFNMPARIMARSVGMRLEGRIEAAIWRNGVPCAAIAYGVTKDEFPVWLQLFCKEHTDIPPEQLEWGTAIGGGRADEPPGR